MTIHPRQNASGIRFNDCFFSEPVSFADWVPQGYPGLFAIITFDPNWAPKPVRVLYFGEFGNNTPASLVLRDCNQAATEKSSKNLWVCVLPLLFTTTAQRCALRNELIAAYNPAWQLERPHQQQNVLTELTAGGGRVFEPQEPTRPRRRIGFNPLSEPAI